MFADTLLPPKRKEKLFSLVSPQQGKSFPGSGGSGY